MKKEHIIDGCKRASWFLSTLIGFIVLIIVAFEEGWDYPDYYLPPAFITWIAVFTIARLSIWVVKGFLGISDQAVEEKVDCTHKQESIQKSEIISSPEVLLGKVESKALEKSENPELIQAPIRKGKSGVGGWLKFFCVQLIILGPLFSIGTLYLNYQQAVELADVYRPGMWALIYETSISAILLIYGFCIGLAISEGSPKGRSFAKTYLIINLVLFFASSLGVFILIGDIPMDSLEPMLVEVISQFIVRFSYFLIWWLYFKFSKRVRNTYG